MEKEAASDGLLVSSLASFSNHRPWLMRYWVSPTDTTSRFLLEQGLWFRHLLVCLDQAVSQFILRFYLTLVQVLQINKQMNEWMADWWYFDHRKLSRVQIAQPSILSCFLTLYLFTSVSMVSFFVWLSWIPARILATSACKAKHSHLTIFCQRIHTKERCSLSIHWYQLFKTSSCWNVGNVHTAPG